MSVVHRANNQPSSEGELIQHATGLLSQQIWCWGRDILRPQGNWLLELGFDRIEPPGENKECSSVYSVELPRGRCVVLRGFGVFYGEVQRGGVFLPRYGFQPRYTTHANLDCPPWSDEDLPKLSFPTDAQRSSCASLTLELIDWMRSYEVTIFERLGIEYRQATLVKWDNGKRPIVPADEMARGWRLLGVAMSENLEAVIPGYSEPRSHSYA